MGKKKYNKIFVKQHSEFTCGLACLSMIINYYGGNIRQEELRSISGTTIQGTSLLGLLQAAQKINLKAEGYETDINILKTIEFPAILHVIKNEHIEHYLVCFGFKQDKFIIGDPALGIISMTDEELDSIWKTKALLMIEPTKDFVKKGSEKKDKYLWFKNILRDDIPILSSAFILGVIIALLGLTTAIFSQKLIDDLIPSKDYHKLILGIFIFIVLLMFSNGLNYLRNIFIARQTRDFNSRLIDDFFSKILYLPKTFFDSIKAGEIVARMNDSRRIQQTLTYLVSEVLINILVLLFSIVYLFLYSWKMALVASACIPMFIILVFMYNRKIIEGQKDIMKSYAMTEVLFIESIQGINDIKIANKQNIFKNSINDLYRFFQVCTYKLNVIGAQYGFISHTISTITLVAIIIIGVKWILDGQLKLGELMAIITVGNMLVVSTSALSGINIRFQEAGVAFSRLYEFFKLKSEFENEDFHPTDNPISEFYLTINQLSFRFIGHKKLLSDVSLEVRKGELITLYGEVGSGKSTLIQILQKHYKPEAGAIRVNGNSFDNFSIPEWRSKVGVVNQTSKIFNGTVGDNICLDNFEDERKSIVEFCLMYGFDSFINKLPQGLYTLLGDDGVNISGGQQQLISIIRALYRKPSLLLLDEPTSSMDDKTEQFILDILVRNKHEFAIILVTHRTRLAEYSDRTYFLENGVIREKMG